MLNSTEAKKLVQNIQNKLAPYTHGDLLKRASRGFTLQAMRIVDDLEGYFKSYLPQEHAKRHRLANTFIHLHFAGALTPERLQQVCAEPEEAFSRKTEATEILACVSCLNEKRVAQIWSSGPAYATGIYNLWEQLGEQLWAYLTTHEYTWDEPSGRLYLLRCLFFSQMLNGCEGTKGDLGKAAEKIAALSVHFQKWFDHKYEPPCDLQESIEALGDFCGAEQDTLKRRAVRHYH